MEGGGSVCEMMLESSYTLQKHVLGLQVQLVARFYKTTPRDTAV